MPSDILAQERLDVILDRYRRAKATVKPWHDQIKKWRSFYDMKHYSKRPKINETQYPDPTPTNVVDVAVGVLGSHPLEFKATGWQPSAQEQEATDKVEKFLNAAVSIASTREEEEVVYSANMNFVRDGSAVVKAVWDPYLANRHSALVMMPNPDAADEEEQGIPMRIFNELPLTTEIIDPLEMFIIPGGRQRWNYIFHATKMSIYDAETQYNFKYPYHAGSETDKMYIEYELVDYWRIAHYPEGDVIINAVLFNDLFIPGWEPRVMQGYEDLPFTLGFFKPVNRKQPAQWGHGVIQPLEPSVKMIERNVNRRQRQIDVFSSLPMLVKSLPGRNVSVDAGFGKSVQMSTDEDVLFPTWPGNAPDSDLQIDYLRSRLQQSGFSDILFGMEGQGAGFAISQMTDQNRIRLIEPIRQIEGFWGRWGQKILKLTRNFAGESLLRVYGVFKGENFADQFVGSDIADYMIKAKIKAEFPNQQVTNAALSTQAADVMPIRMRLERYWDVDQPGDAWTQRMMEMAEQHPIMIEFGILEQLHKLAATGNVAAAQTIERMMNEQQQAGGRPEGTGGGPKPNLAGTRSTDGTPTPQEEGRESPGKATLDSVERLANAQPGLDGSII